MTDIPALLALLVKNDIEFILVGGVAATVHGSARLTKDLDVVYRRTPRNMARLQACLAPHKPYLRGAPPGLPFQFEVETIRRGLNFTLQTDLGAIDLLGEITGGGGYDDLLAHADKAEAYGVSCLCINLVRLIHVKRAAGRPRDLDAVAELEALLEERKKQRET